MFVKYFSENYRTIGIRKRIKKQIRIPEEMTLSTDLPHYYLLYIQNTFKSRKKRL